ncbi:hypothetical protein TeGR_g15021, partial [Tetraparma gracilis]
MAAPFGFLSALSFFPASKRPEVERATASAAGRAQPGSPGSPSHQFTYDAVFPEDACQELVYRSAAGGMLAQVLAGYNATVLAYGQTGSGKTYTMGSDSRQGTAGCGEGERLPEGTGIIPRFVKDLFDELGGERGAEARAGEAEAAEAAEGGAAPAGAPATSTSVACSFLEVYGEDVHDLLSPPPPNSASPSLPLREDPSGVSVIGLSHVPVSSPAGALDVLRRGTMHRTTAATLMNKTSSRSHAVFTVVLSRTTELPLQGDKPEGARRGTTTTMSKLTFVDLAGSERMKKTGAVGSTMKEGIQINVGLLALGNVINALGSPPPSGEAQHVPYRQSKLTRLLQDALGGNSSTAFLACVSPSESNVGESLSTLKYANRARNIKNKPIKSVDPALRELRRLGAIRAALREELAGLKFDFEPRERENMLTDEVRQYLGGIEERALRKLGDGGEPGFLLPPPPPSGGAGAYAHLPASSSAAAHAPLHLSEDAALISAASPDEDMEILDQLLTLQQGEADYARNRAETDEEIAKVDSELAEHAELFDKLRSNLEVYHGMKGKYEQLVAEVTDLEREKDTLASQLERAEKDPSRGCSQTIRKKMVAIEDSLARARADTRKQQSLLKKAEAEAARARAMKKKVEDLKKGKVALQKKQEEVIKRHRTFTEKKTREIETLKKKNRQTGKKASKLETECTKHQRALERRTTCVRASERAERLLLR